MRRQGDKASGECNELFIRALMDSLNKKEREREKRGREGGRERKRGSVKRRVGQ